MEEAGGEYSVHFGVKARTFVYEDENGQFLCRFDLRRSGSGSKEQWQLVFRPGITQLRRPEAEAPWDGRVARRVKEFAANCGYVVVDSEGY